MISKSTFHSFSLPHADGNYFLRPDRILGAFRVYPKKPLLIDESSASDLEKEINLDISMVILQLLMLKVLKE